VLDDVAGAVLDVRQQPVGESELAAARDCVLDALACGLAGSGKPGAVRLRRVLERDEAGSSSVIGSATGLRPGAAIVANAAAIRLLDFNDVYAGRNNLHPSEMVLPLVLLAAERDGWSGRELLEEVVRGYRVCFGVGELWEGLLGRGWAPTATLGQIAAAAFAGLLDDLDGTSLVHAIAIAAVNAPALGVVFRGELSDAKNLVNGFASLSGWQAARLASGGVTGPRDALDGPAGLGEQVAGSLDRTRLGCWEQYGPGSAWLKAYPTVFHIHSAIHAAIELRRQEPRVATPTAVRITVSERATAVAASPDRWRPATTEAAQFSLPYCVAWALVHGDCGPRAFTRDAIEDATVARVLETVEVQTDSRFTGYRGASVEVRLNDGTSAAQAADAPPGHPDNPLTSAELRTKAATLLGGDGLLDVCDRLPGAPNLDELFGYLRTPREAME